MSGVVRTALDGMTGFDSLIQQKGIADALESFATSIFSRKTLEGIFSIGGISSLLGSVAKNLTTLVTGEQAQELKISDTASLFFDLAGKFIGKKEEGVIQIGTFGVDSFGKWGLLAGKVVASILGDLVFAGNVTDGQLQDCTVSGPDGEIFTCTPEGPGPIIIEGPESSEGTATFSNLFFKFIPLGISLLLKEGFVHAAEIAVSPAVSTANALVDLVLLNGITPFGNLTGATVPAYFDAGNPFREKLNSLGVTDSAIKAIPLFKSGIDILSWLFDQKLYFELREEFAKIRQAQPDKPFVPLAYSGAGRPLLDALGDPAQNGFGVTTAIMVGAPLFEEDTFIKSPSLERIINIYGSDDLLYLSQDPTPAVFTSPYRSLETINIELLGIDHNEYFYSNEEVPTPEEIKATNFIARLAQASLTEETLVRFLQDFAGFPQEKFFVDPITGLKHPYLTYVVDIKNIAEL